MSRALSRSLSKSGLAIGLAICLISRGSVSASVTLIDDSFTAADNTALIGRFPAPTDSPGNAYGGNGNVSLVGGFFGTPYEADILSNTARVGGDAGLGLNLGVATPTQFILSITFNISADTENQTNNAHRGAGLGFFSSVATGSGGSSHGFNNFTGLAVDRTGSVRLIVAGANSGIATTVAGFDPSLTHTLSYLVDTTAGIGSSTYIYLDGVGVVIAAPVNTFTVARTALAGFYNSSGATEVATFDNFMVVVVPEPAALMAVIGVTLLICLHYLGTARVRSSHSAGVRQ